METFKPGINWVDDVIPEGLPLKSTTIIIGLVGSGKPLIGKIFFTTFAFPEKTNLLKIFTYEINQQNRPVFIHPFIHFQCHRSG
jgi:hypothetical protein